MEDTLGSFETAKILKEKGFDVPCLHFYTTNVNAGVDFILVDYIGEGQFGDITELTNHNAKGYYLPRYSAPTLSLAQKWLREVHNIHIQIIFLPINNRFIFAIYKYGKEDIESVLEYETYELALEEVLQEALKLI